MVEAEQDADKTPPPSSRAARNDAGATGLDGNVMSLADKGGDVGRGGQTAGKDRNRRRRPVTPRPGRRGRGPAVASRMMMLADV
jgi:hypothetical protein